MPTNVKIVEIVTKYGINYIGELFSTIEGVVVLNCTLRVIALPNVVTKQADSVLFMRNSVLTNKSVANILETDIITLSMVTDKDYLKLYNDKVIEFNVYQTNIKDTQEK